MADDKINSYAQAILAVSAAEGNGTQVEDELHRFAQLLEGEDELKTRNSKSRRKEN